MNPKRLQYFDQIREAPYAVPPLRRFYLKYRDYAVQIPQMPSGKSQVSPPISTSEHPFNIAQTPSAQSAATFPLKKRLIEWGEAAVQSKSRER
jgi:hypothetical protein